jgi:sugar/nucleoside kinase (ribokinase family)
LIGILRTSALGSAFQGLRGNCEKESLKAGYSAQEVPWRLDFDSYKAAHPFGVTVQVTPAGLQAVRGILELCKEKGIPVVLVYPPEYIENQALTRNRAEVFKNFEEMAAEYGVPFWNYSDAPLCSEKRCFYNSQHLNADGARQFSQDCGKRLAEYLAGAGKRGKLRDVPPRPDGK